MLEIKNFFDLCVPVALVSPQHCKKTIETLYDYGYRTIAINQVCQVQENDKEEGVNQNKKKKKGETVEPVPLPYDLSTIEEIKKELNIIDFKVFNRLTISFSRQENLHIISKSENYKKYDIIAVNPLNTNAFMYCCKTFEADILTFNPESKYNYKLNRKMYNLLVQKGYYFELLYGPAIEDQTKRKNLIHASHLYHTFGKSKNIIFSSGASNVLHFRNPYDVISLGFIFGLNEIQCKNAVSYSCRLLILSAIGRRHGKAVMFAENIELKDDDEIMIEENEDDQEQPVLKKHKQL